MFIKKFHEAKKSIKTRPLVDSGAIYTVVPTDDLKIRDAPAPRGEPQLANGEVTKRKVRDAYFEFRGKRGSAPVVFGEEGDSRILGVLTLEALVLR